MTQWTAFKSWKSNNSPAGLSYLLTVQQEIIILQAWQTTWYSVHRPKHKPAQDWTLDYLDGQTDCKSSKSSYTHLQGLQQMRCIAWFKEQFIKSGESPKEKKGVTPVMNIINSSQDSYSWRTSKHDSYNTVCIVCSTQPAQSSSKRRRTRLSVTHLNSCNVFMPQPLTQ